MKAGERRKRRKQVIKLDALVSDLLTGYRVTDAIRGYRIQAEWRRIVGDRLARRTWPGQLTDGVLPVYVSNSSWLHELSFLRDDLAATVNRGLSAKDAKGKGLVREVRLQLGRRPRMQIPVGPTVRLRPALPVRRPLPAPARGPHLAAIENESKSIDDPELRSLVADVRRRLDL